MKPRFTLLLVTDRKASPLPLPEAVSLALSAIPAGAAGLQLREKDLGAHEIAELARVLLPICRAHSTPLLVNDRVDVALALGLDGVHLASTSMMAVDARRLLPPSSLLGLSCHSAAEVHSRKDGIDFAVLGPIFETLSKREYGEPLGPSALETARPAGIPLYAIGGVQPDRLNALPQIHGIAAIGAWLATREPAVAVAHLYASWLASPGSRAPAA